MTRPSTSMERKDGVQGLKWKTGNTVGLRTLLVTVQPLCVENGKGMDLGNSSMTIFSITFISTFQKGIKTEMQVLFLVSACLHDFSAKNRQEGLLIWSSCHYYEFRET